MSPGCSSACRQLLVNTAWYSSPFCAAVAVKVYVVEVAPEMLVNDVPPLVLTCHCTVSVLLELAAVKETLWPAFTDLLPGCAVTLSTVSVAGLLSKLPALLVNTAWYSSPFCAAVAVNV